MNLSPCDFGERSRLRVLLDHFSIIEDDREPHRVAYPLAELLLLAVCGTIADYTRLESQFSRMNCQMFSVGLSLGHLGGNGTRVMLGGPMRRGGTCWPGSFA